MTRDEARADALRRSGGASIPDAARRLGCAVSLLEVCRVLGVPFVPEAPGPSTEPTDPPTEAV